VQISCEVSCEGGANPVIVIADDGAGLDPAQEAFVRQRGGRLDQGGGAGLGLAIAQDILDAYGWRMEMARSPLGGLEISLRA
jgi:signal transduction histidine kinase